MSEPLEIGAQPESLRPMNLMIIRILDVMGAVVGLLVTAPIIFLAMIAVWCESGSPVIFVQNRIGRDNCIFRIYKLRTMVQGAPQVAKDKLAGAMTSTVTRVGRFLRSSSIDELPQLVNVLKGDMSLVGPRPALYNQTDLVELRTGAGVHRLRPGLTGLAQVMGREELGLAEKVRYDKALLNTLTPLTYCLLIIRTIGVLLNRRGAY